MLSVGGFKIPSFGSILRTTWAIRQRNSGAPSNAPRRRCMGGAPSSSFRLTPSVNRHALGEFLEPVQPAEVTHRTVCAAAPLGCTVASSPARPEPRPGSPRFRVVHRPRLLSDNGPCYVSGELADYLETHQIPHPRGAPYHPMTQSKIERYHRSMKNVVKLEKYYSPWELERAITRFVDDYNHRGCTKRWIT